MARNEEGWPKLMLSFVANCISTSKGASFLQFGDAIRFTRPQTSKVTPQKRKKIKTFKRQTDSKGVLRFAAASSRGGLEIGKVESSLSSFLYPLFSAGLIDIEGDIVYCPSQLTFFSDIVINVHVFSTSQLFQYFAAHNHNNSLDAVLSDSLFEMMDHIGRMKGIVADEVNNTHLSDFQLDKVLEADKMRVLELPVHEVESKHLHCTLRDYQKQALGWLVNREKCQDPDVEARNEDVGETRLHPLWMEMSFEDQTPFYFNKFSGRLSLCKVSAVPSSSGGVLADEMGMGKTIEMIALLCHSKSESEQFGFGECTLVVTPMSLLSQWSEEIEAHSSLVSSIFYGGQRQKHELSNQIQNNEIDVVLTTYGVLASVSDQSSVLFDIPWRRIVLDEAHYIKNRSTNQAKAAFRLKADSRWCLTGTPVQNSLDDVFSLVHFLKESPWQDFAFWNRMISKPFEKGDSKALNRLQAMLQPLLLRRTKEMRLNNGELLVKLPEKEHKDVYIEFTQKENDFYQSLFKKSKQRFDGLIQQGTALNSYTHVLELLLRLRQACDHPFLVLGTSKNDQESNQERMSLKAKLLALSQSGQSSVSEEYIDGLLEAIRTEDEAKQCPICLEVMELPVISRCGHLFCGECMEQVLGRSNSCMCPVCRAIIHKNELTNCSLGMGNEISIVSNFMHSSKTRALIDELALISERDESEKTVVFSQWTSMLNIVETALSRESISFLRFDGSLSQKKRESVLEQFSQDNAVKVLLVSLKAGGVGLNLTRASNVILLDSWWNPAVDQQAIDRIHRVGQIRKVFVKRFVISGTVEERILQLQQKKQEMARGVLARGVDESRQMRLDDLQMLFSGFE